jgi:anaerobic selenocysteine-containing dehydrogenase
MDSSNALPLPPSAMSLQGLDTHIATGLGALQEQSQTTLREFAPGSVAGRHKAAAPIHVREWPARNESPQLSAQFSPQSWAPAQVATRQHVITLQLQDSSTRDRLDEYLCSFWDTRKLFFMHPHDMAAHGLSEGDSVLVSAAAPGVQMRQMVRLRVVPYDLPRGTARGYFRECAALVTSDSASADGGIGVHVVSMAH